LLSVKSKQKSK